jgi:multidrug resistance protein, MATE family
MNQTFSKKQKLNQLFYILVPVLITQLGLFSMSFFDITMSGHYSPFDLAGVAIGSSIWVPVYTGLSGILLAVTPIVAHLVGAKKNSEVSFAVIQGLYVSILMALIVLAVGSFSLNPILNGMQLEEQVRSIAHDYLVAISYGILPLFAYSVLRSFIDALGKTRVTMLVTLCSLPINVFLNYVLIFGKFGFPKLGGVGSGYASAITYWVISLIATIIIVKQHPFSEYGIFNIWYRISLKKWNEILNIGVPIGLSIFFETGIFAAVTLLMSNFDTATIASHQAALNFASLLYMLPLSISMALTILVGFEIGAKRYSDAREYSWMGVAIAVLLSFLCAIILFFFRTEIAGLYSEDPNVIHLTTQFLLFALFFQLSDAIQAPVQGALRGYKDVNITFIMSLVSYWVIGLPLGFFMARQTNFGAFGYWIGLIAGLAVGAICLSGRLLWLHRSKYQNEHSQF